MKKTSKMIYLILLLFINLSCIKQQSNEKGRNNSELVSTSKTDTLKFTSGIRAIFQDSKANYRDWETDRKSTRLNSSH